MPSDNSFNLAAYLVWEESLRIMQNKAKIEEKKVKIEVQEAKVEYNLGSEDLIEKIN